MSARRRGIKLVIALVVLAVVLAVVDRVSAAVAERAASSYLAKQAHFVSKPKVEIHGVPFLTQAVQGHYDDIEISSSAVRLDQITASAVDIQLRGAHLPLSTAFGSKIKVLVSDSVQARATVSYAELTRLSLIPGLALAESGGQLTATATLPIPGIGTTLPVTGVATIRVVDGAVVLNVTKLSAAGVSLPAASLVQLTATLATPTTIPQLPFGIVVDSVVPAAAGVVISGSGHDVQISAAR